MAITPKTSLTRPSDGGFRAQRDALRSQAWMFTRPIR
jgi:hypothetical protein